MIAAPPQVLRIRRLALQVPHQCKSQPNETHRMVLRKEQSTPGFLQFRNLQNSPKSSASWQLGMKQMPDGARWWKYVGKRKGELTETRMKAKLVATLLQSLENTRPDDSSYIITASLNPKQIDQHFNACIALAKTWLKEDRDGTGSATETEKARAKRLKPSESDLWKSTEAQDMTENNAQVSIVVGECVDAIKLLAVTYMDWQDNFDPVMADADKVEAEAARRVQEAAMLGRRPRKSPGKKQVPPSHGLSSHNSTGMSDDDSQCNIFNQEGRASAAA